MYKYIIGVLALLTSAPVYAAWHEASSDHFVIYSDQSEKQIRQFSERLELYHDTMRVLFGRPDVKPSPSNRVTIYALSSTRKVRDLLETDNRFIAGFYKPRAGGSLAVIPEVDSAGRTARDSELILLHEYAHHFLIASSERAYPRWFSEGFAEFYGTAGFERNGAVRLGLPASHRGYELQSARRVPIEMLLDTMAYMNKDWKGYDAFYGQSWGLFHMLQFDQKREGQTIAYLKELSSGKSEIDAAKAAFGDLDELNKDLQSYLRQKRLLGYEIGADKLKTGEINIRRLREGEADAMPIRIVSKRGVTREQAEALLPEAREVAAKHPNEPAVFSVLAEAEYDAGNDAEAIAAADRAIALNSNAVNAYIQKGYALARIAADADDAEAAWAEMRREFVKVNKLENDNPIPLIQFFRSYAEQGIEPPDIAVQGLEWALTLAPYDAGLRMNLSEYYLQKERYADAVVTLKPLAFSPHENDYTGVAAAKLKEAEAKLETAEQARPSGQGL